MKEISGRIGVREIKREIKDMLLLTHEAICLGVIESDYSRGGVVVRKDEDGYQYTETISKKDFAKLLVEDDEGYMMVKDAVDHYKGKDGVFKINVTEILNKIIEVKASSYDEAIEKVQKMYDNSEIVLNSDDFVSFSVK